MTTIDVPENSTGGGCSASQKTNAFEGNADRKGCHSAGLANGMVSIPNAVVEHGGLECRSRKKYVGSRSIDRGILGRCQKKSLGFGFPVQAASKMVNQC